MFADVAGMRILKDRSPAIAPVKLFERYGVIRMEVEANSHELRHLISRSWKAGINYVKTAIHLWESGHPFLCLLILATIPIGGMVAMHLVKTTSLLHSGTLIVCVVQAFFNVFGVGEYFHNDARANSRADESPPTLWKWIGLSRRILGRIRTTSTVHLFRRISFSGLTNATFVHQ